jgi:hypothetical protein
MIDTLPNDTPFPAQNILVYRAEAFCVVEGVNEGDALSIFDDLEPDDTYALRDDATALRMALHTHADGTLEIASASATGRVGAPLHLDCALMLMSPDGQVFSAIVMVETEPDQTIAAIYLLPLDALRPGAPYRLVKAERDAARRTFAQIACVSFSRGTHITMATGAQVPIEKLRVGDRVLTRDNGAKAVRWIGQTTVRATGEFAPIVIAPDTLNNLNELVVSPQHRLFVYQRSDQLGVGRSELLVKARHLVNGTTVRVRSGGYVDYFQLLFDSHHIIYAEGIAAESMLVEPRTRPALPPELLERLPGLMPRHSSRDAHGTDVQKALLERPDAIDLLRRASMQ